MVAVVGTIVVIHSVWTYVVGVVTVRVDVDVRTLVAPVKQVLLAGYVVVSGDDELVDETMLVGVVEDDLAGQSVTVVAQE